MRILFWVPYPREGASNRYRVEQYLPFLENEGILFSVHSFWGSAAFKVLYKKGFYARKFIFFLIGTLSRVRDLVMVNSYDAVFVHRESYPIGGAFFESMLFLIKKPVIFDFDDAIFMPSCGGPNSFIDCLKFPGKTAKIIRMSREVIAGNNYLLDYSLRHNLSSSFIPTSIDTDKFRPIQKEKSETVTIGWMGSLTTAVFLKEIKKVFERISDKYSHVRFVIVGGPGVIEGKNIINKRWSLETEIDDLRCFDIGIMPMPDSEWSKGKCAFKAIQYMSMGIPPVVSGVGVNTTVINDGSNGLIANNEDEWLRKLSMLIEDDKLRNRMGIAARKTVEEKYSLGHNAPVFLEIVKRTCKRA